METNKLIIFDFDGVLVDTEYTTFEYYKELLKDYGISLTDEHFRFKIGRKSVDFFQDVLQDKFNQSLVDELVMQKREAFQQDIKKYLVPIPGAFELLELCQQAGLHMAIGSQNEKPLIQKAIKEFGIHKYFQFVTSLQDIKNKKPDPEVFLLVANKLGIDPSQAVVIEDSPIGITAAKNGGFKAVGVTSSFSREDLAAADKVVDSMTELTPEILQNL